MFNLEFLQRLSDDHALTPAQKEVFIEWGKSEHRSQTEVAESLGIKRGAFVQRMQLIYKKF
jgi:DNA-binding CsgD family transcriptional regulator